MSEQLEIAQENAQENLTALAQNPYPGRGIVTGLNTLGDTAMQAYWVMGRSENSRNRVLVEDEGVVRTEAHDASKVTDPSLIIYNAMRVKDRRFHVVSNGDQTDTIMEGWEHGSSFDDSVRTRSYEPDEPNFTPRISGYLATYIRPEIIEVGFGLYELAVTRKDEESDGAIHSFYRGPLVSDENNGIGQCVHTYSGDGDPLPSFDREPYPIPVGEGLDETAEMYWEHLDTDNRVALVVKGIHLATGKVDYRIINAHGENA